MFEQTEFNVEAKLEVKFFHERLRARNQCVRGVHRSMFTLGGTHQLDYTKALSGPEWAKSTFLNMDLTSDFHILRGSVGVYTTVRKGDWCDESLALWVSVENATGRTLFCRACMSLYQEGKRIFAAEGSWKTCLPMSGSEAKLTYVFTDYDANTYQWMTLSQKLKTGSYQLHVNVKVISSDEMVMPMMEDPQTGEEEEQEPSANSLGYSLGLMQSRMHDFILVCQSKEFPCHKFILSCRSPVFAAMLESGLKEAQENKAVIDATAGAVEGLIHIMYFGCFSKSHWSSPDFVRGLLLAHKYLLDMPLQSFTEVPLNRDTAVLTATLGHITNNMPLRARALQYILCNANMTVVEDQLEEAPHELREIITSFVVTANKQDSGSNDNLVWSSTWAEDRFLEDKSGAN